MRKGKQKYIRYELLVNLTRSRNEKGVVFMLRRTKRRIAIAVIAVLLIAAGIVAWLKFGKKPAGEDPKPTAVPTVDATNNSNTVTPEATETPTEAPTQTPTEELTPTAEPTLGPTGTPIPTLDPNSQLPIDEDPTPTPFVDEATPTPVGPTPIPAPTFAPLPTAAPTPTPMPTATPKPTATPLPTATVAPTATPKPTKAPTPTMVPEATSNYFVTELAKICGVTGSDLADALTMKGILPAGIDTKKIARKDAFVAMYNAANYLNMTSDYQMFTLVREYERLSDVSKLSEGEKIGAYFVYANGIVEGKSDGNFTRTRSMNPNAVLSDADAKLYLNRLSKKDPKFALSPDGQVRRTSTLKNMNMYPYLLDSIPDSFYTRLFGFMDSNMYNTGKVTSDGKKWVDGGGYYSSPAMFLKLHGPNGTSTRYHVLDSVASQKKLETEVESFLMKVFNVNYNTTPNDAAWKKYMLDMMNAQSVGSGVKEFDEALVENYFRLMKENHTIVECDMVRAEASTIHEDAAGRYIRCYVHYRVVSFDKTDAVYVKTPELKGDVNPILFGLSTKNLIQLDNLKKNEWRDGYFDVILGEGGLDGTFGNKLIFPRVDFFDTYNQYSIVNY